MGRPRRPIPPEKVSLRISPEQLAEAKAHAGRAGVSLNRWLGDLIDAVTKGVLHHVPMDAFAGMDCSAFPGMAIMKSLRHRTNLRLTGFYLGPAPEHPETDWMGQRSALVADGWGLVPIYVGQQVGVGTFSAPQGTVDGQQAASLMAKAGFPPHQVVFLDLENGPPLSEAERGYVLAWAVALRAEFYQPGVYCSHLLAPEIVALVPGVRIWAWRVRTTAEHDVPGTIFSTASPALSGFPAAEIWQHDQNARIETGLAASPSLLVDLSTSRTPNPAA